MLAMAETDQFLAQICHSDFENEWVMLYNLHYCIAFELNHFTREKKDACQVKPVLTIPLIWHTRASTAQSRNTAIGGQPKKRRY